MIFTSRHKTFKFDSFGEISQNVYYAQCNTVYLFNFFASWWIFAKLYKSWYIFPKYFLNVHITPFIFCANLSSFIYNSDQTPTPTKFLKNCEEIGLFNELKNPFEEAFKKAMDTESQAEVSLTAKKVVYKPCNCHLKIPFHNVHLFIYFSIKILYIFCLIYM